jgi:translation initiation factor IF-1
MRIVVLIVLAFCFQSEVYAQSIFELDGSQSMLMTGKGPGQDATINPFQGEDCYAIIENLGNELFSVRIQQQGEIVKIIAVKPQKKKKIKLLSGQELYLDSETKSSTQARVSYQDLSQN